MTVEDVALISVSRLDGLPPISCIHAADVAAASTVGCFSKLAKVLLAIGSRVFVKNEPFRADFEVSVNGRSYLVEAKTHPEATRGRELASLLSEGNTDRLIFVTPSSISDQQKESLRISSDGNLFLR